MDTQHTAAKLRVARETIVRAAAGWQSLGLDTSAIVPALTAIQDAIAELEAAARPTDRKSRRQAPPMPAD